MSLMATLIALFLFTLTSTLTSQAATKQGKLYLNYLEAMEREDVNEDKSREKRGEAVDFDYDNEDFDETRELAWGKCLSQNPGKQCNIVVKFKGFPKVQCNQLVPKHYLINRPRLRARRRQRDMSPRDVSERVIKGESISPKEEKDALDELLGDADYYNMPRLLLVMFDPDAPVSSNVAVGFLHWMATVRLKSNGRLKILNDRKEYIMPRPPSGKHRYQIYLFKLPAEEEAELAMVGIAGRAMDFCAFVKSNNLEKPIGAAQFVVAANREKRK